MYIELVWLTLYRKGYSLPSIFACAIYKIPNLVKTYRADYTCITDFVTFKSTYWLPDRIHILGDRKENPEE